MKNCSIVVSAPSPRKAEPLTCGVPWPQGGLVDLARLVLRDDHGEAVPLQARALDLWPDGSVRWALLDWKADVEATTTYRVGVEAEGGAPAREAVRAEAEGGVVRVDTGAASFEARAGADFPFASVGGAATGAVTRLSVEDEQGRVYSPRIDRLGIEDAGPVRASVRAWGRMVADGAGPLAEFEAVLHFFSGSATVRFEWTIRNPRRAIHPGNLWDLGDAGSLYLRDASFRVALPGGTGRPAVRYSAEPSSSFEEATGPVEVYQDSSGGENWKGTIHLNRRRVVPNSFRGYRLRLGLEDRPGHRATPVVTLERGGRSVGIAMEHFWQAFPKSLSADDDSVTLGIFPRQYGDMHEIQGGEQKTHVFHVAFGHDGTSEALLGWCRLPARARAEPGWYCASGAVPYLSPRDSDDPEYSSLVGSAIEGPDTFERKREVVDEYGWRHFGDIYGDHEAVLRQGPPPLVSHYNNQYDPVAGFAYQYLRSGDDRWRARMDELARHVVDIDIYHTDRDKSAYNHGLFWHTCHYVDADTSTHRTYPRAGGVSGGGPSGGHLYTSGLLLHHFLTGDPRSREAVLELSRWVIDADDGRKTVFRWLDRGHTGHPTASSTPDYHGPGRAPANSLRALLDGHRLSGDPALLAKAEQIIRRCIHPADDVAARDLLDAERKWFYTMFLQSLGRYLDDKAELGQVDRMYAYARESLLRYARWMAENEYPYLERPEILEYPTETWAAQDMRKSDVFAFAAMHAAGADRERFLERCDFFFRASTRTLAEMPTRTLARPVVLLLSNGLMHGYLRLHPDASAPVPAMVPDFGEPEAFVPQKIRAKKKAKAIAAAATAALVAVLGVSIALLVS